jgi:CheY-like chemotaxis protein
MTKRALIVDDDKDVRLLWSAVARDCQMAVAEAVDGREALTILAADQQFDLIVMDVMMPHVSGAEVLKYIRATDSLKNIPVIMSTANRTTQSLADMPIDDLTTYINKAAGMERLRRGMRDVLKM